MKIKNKKWFQKWWGKVILGFIALSLACTIAFGLYVLNLMKLIKEGKVAQPELYSEDAQIKKIRELAESPNSYWLGSSKPKITIVEFSDYSCPYCKISYPVIRKILKKYENDIKLIFRDLPLHQNSESQALAGRCAGEQNKFWLMHDLLFDQQGNNLNSQEIIKSAKSLNLDINKFEICIQSEKYLPLIKKDLNDAIDLDVGGTPSWFINGYKIEGAISETGWENIIDKYLESITNTSTQ